MSQDMLNNIVIEFDLPFVLRLVDSIKKETTPDGYQQYIFTLNDVPAMLRCEKRLRDLGGIQIATEDRRGLLNYSVAQVWFDRQLFERYGVETNYRMKMDLLITASLSFVNRFLDLYRDVTSLYWISLIQRSDIPNIRMIGVHSDGTQDPFTYGTLGTGVGLGSLITEAQDGLLRERLSSTYVPDELQRLAYEVASMYEKEDYWSAALAVEILFEAKVARIMRIAFKTTGITDAEVDKKFHQNNRQPRSITNLIKSYIKPPLASINLEDATTSISKAYLEWCVKARDTRNDIAHGKSINVSRVQAKEAISAVKVFLNQSL